MRQYIASYQDGRERCWDIILKAENYEEARKEARRKQKEMGRLWSLRLKK